MMLQNQLATYHIHMNMTKQLVQCTAHESIIRPLLSTPKESAQARLPKADDCSSHAYYHCH